MTLTIIEEPMPDVIKTFADDVRRGLTSPKKTLACRWFYDAEGSQLFDQICALDEYYLWRTEHQILKTHAQNIASAVPEGANLVELGSGSASKTRLLIDALLERSGALIYAPIDVSHTVLRESAEALLEGRPTLSVLAMAAEYERGLELAKLHVPGTKLWAWLGSNVGNFDRAGAARFLRRVKSAMSPGDHLLMGVDLRKDRAVLERAYDDAQGVTARFNQNLLHRINRTLGGNFDVPAFRHRAVYDEDAGTIRMYLVSGARQVVHVAALDLTVVFEAGEAVHTEDSYKYSAPEIAALADAAGLTIAARYTDRDERFVDVLLRS